MEVDTLSVEELESGLRTGIRGPVCVVCGKHFENGVIYRESTVLMDADLAAATHVKKVHGGMLRVLLDLQKEKNGLTDLQKTVVECLARGLSDREIGKALGGRTESTVRNHRFQLRRRITEARILAAIAGILETAERERPGPGADGAPGTQAAGSFITYHADLPADDERIVTTRQEAERILGRYMDETHGLRMTGFPKKQKEKLVLLKRISEEFESGRHYTEKEVNTILRPIYDDYVTIRRYLIDYRFILREPGGGDYWLNA